MRFSYFLLRRLLYTILVLFGLSILIFIIARTLPGDPARLALGPFAAKEQIEKLRHTMGMDKPLPLQYWTYITGIFRGDFGLSFQTRRNVALDIAHYLPATVELVLMAIVWVLILGVPLGVMAARYKDRWPDNLVRVISFAGVAVPPFVVGIMLQLVFSYLLGILPTTGRLGLLTSPPVRQPDRRELQRAWRRVVAHYPSFLCHCHDRNRADCSIDKGKHERCGEPGLHRGISRVRHTQSNCRV